ncbi:MAG TPA: endolytic transglycosylase MltG [Candidatus Micrarchaeaceae archaeon]|nr:endolytic transglycosylase MltG [Candidatus Micrarchaeaceae archaeon]
MRRHPILASCLVLLVLLIAAGAALAVLVRQELSPAGSHRSHKVLFAVIKDESLTQVADSLQARHLVRNGFLFKLFAETKQLQLELKPGKFELDPGMSLTEIVDVLKGPPLSQAFNVTVPDGLRLAQEAQLLQSDGLFSAASYLKVANSATSFPGITPLAGTPAGAGWEGLAFGDTYQVLPAVTPYQLLERQLQDFQTRLGQQINQGAAAVGLTPYQVVVLASIVSGEAATVTDRGLVAGVFFNRLRLGMMLQSDVTVLYAQSLAGNNGSAVNTQFASPYNTYRHVGLPPGPIDSPGASAIEAVLHPTASDYLYFLALPSGKVEYSVTLAQHNAQIQQAGLG